jgi:type IV pilus assembly protein PilM
VALTEEELASQIEIEADSLIPFPLDEVSLDFETLDINESDPSKVMFYSVPLVLNQLRQGLQH